jgi:glucosamine-6-phosphate deaminase
MTNRPTNSTPSHVEQLALEMSGQKLVYPPTEKIGTVVVSNFPALGRLAAMRFLEWVQQNPEGVISLPTGKTPEHFIKWVTRTLQRWEDSHIQKELEEAGIDASRKPEMRGLRFVQIDEFYPINPQQHNSFYHYVQKYYIDGFGLDPQRALLINCEEIGLPEGTELEDVWPTGEVDLSLRFRQPKDHQEQLQQRVLEAVDQWCDEYEQRIREMGGIGFFLGGIGPDGHIGFNVRGSDHHSTTRLTPTNYETQAAAATDLGGIEVSRRRLVITIGLATITYNPECVAVIIAAGEAKARIVADAIQQEKHIHYPATALQDLPNARFYLTRGAAKLLVERQHEILVKQESVSAEEVERIIIDLALKRRKRVVDLTRDDFQVDRFAAELLRKRVGKIPDLTRQIDQSLRQKIEAGTTVRRNQVFLHTEPHHDDLMLGYLPYIVRHIRDSSNRHFFVCLTSGFTAVTNGYMLDILTRLRSFLDHGHFDALIAEGYFDPTYQMGCNRDVWQYLDGVASDRQSLKDEGIARRLLRNLMFIYDERDIDQIRERIEELINYFETQYPGKKDLPHIQQLKGMCREWEADCLWGYFGWNSDSVFHLRLGFYKGDIFTEEPTVERDVLPVFNLLCKVKPTVVSAALDPEASGPDTHYKVMQAITEALKLYERETGNSDIEVWGYRNVWYRFHPSDANIFVPVSLNMFALQHNAFMNAFLSQKDASFPSWEHDGPFCELAQKIQVEQYNMLKVCLGRQFFHEHPNPLIRATRGLVFLKSLTLPEFYQRSRELRRSTELR